jgi:hypothetical protein
VHIRVSAYRVPYWVTKSENHFYTVERQSDRHGGEKWGIFEGDQAWVGDQWIPSFRHPDSYAWDEDLAKALAGRLAFEENQRIVDIMENRFPGEFRHGPYDMSEHIAVHYYSFDDEPGINIPAEICERCSWISKGILVPASFCPEARLVMWGV